MTNQQSEPVTAELAIEYFEWRLSLEREPENQECYRMAIAAIRREGGYRKFLQDFVAWADGPDPVNGNFPMVHDLAEKAEKALTDNPTP